MSKNNKESHDEIEVYGGTGDKPVFKNEEERKHWEKLFIELREQRKEDKKKQWRKHKLGWEKQYPDDINKFESEEQLVKFLEDCLFTINSFETEYALKELDRVFNRTKKESFVMAKEVSDFISTSQGTWFSVGQVYTRLHLTSRQEKKNVVTCLLRERDKGVVKSHPSKNGWYRQIISESEPLEFDDATQEEEVRLEWPLSMNELNMDFCPGDIVLIAGDQNAGKTTWLFNFIKLNMEKHNIFYYTSEMGKARLKRRLREFNDVEEWNFKAFMRTANWADAVAQHPNDINIIDFIELYDSFYGIAGILSEIWQETIGGITLVAIQKSKDKELGRGGDFGKEKPVLYLTIDFGKMKIVKAKSWKGEHNPNGMITELSIINGAKMLQKGVWHDEDSDPLEKKGRF